MPRRDLILGVWTNQGISGVEPFVASILSSGFVGDMVLFVHGLDNQTIDALARAGVMLCNAGPYLRRDIDIQTIRYVMYLDFLARHSAAYEHVMLSDVRDVVIQSDPFAKPLDADVVFAMERITIGNCRHNGAWALHAYGKHYLSQVRHLPVSCSGTTFGTTAGILQYLALMIEEITSSKVNANKAMDQAFHTHIVHANPPDRSYRDDHDQLVATLAHMPEPSISFSGEKILIDGHPVPVVHQWDRNPAVADFISKFPRYRLAGRPTAAAVNAGKKQAVFFFDGGTATARQRQLALTTLRATGFRGKIFCVTTQNIDDTDETLMQYGCEICLVPARTMSVQNLAHIAFCEAIDRTNVGGSDDVVMLDSFDFAFLGNPFLNSRDRLEFHAEGARLISECELNTRWLGYFDADPAAFAMRYVVSSCALSGPFSLVAAFYRDLDRQTRARPNALAEPKSLQGFFNLQAHAQDQSGRRAVMPNGAVFLFRVWNEGGSCELAPALRYNSMRPAVLYSPQKHEFMRRALELEMNVDFADHHVSEPAQ